MSQTTVDFETRSRADLTKVGIHKYAADPSTEVVILAHGPTKETVKAWIPSLNSRIPSRAVEGKIIHAHNATFERIIFRECLGIPLPPNRFHCSAAQSIQSGLARSLDKSCEALKMTEGKDMGGHALMKKMTKPGKDGTFDNNEDNLRALYRYCVQDVRAEIGLESRLPPIAPFMQAAWEAHESMNDRGIPVDRDLVVGAARILSDTIEECANTVYEITEGKIKTGGQVAKILKYVNERGVNIDCLRTEVVAEALEDEGMDPDARRVLLLRRASSGVAAKKHEAIINYLMPDDRVRGGYVFPGAHTGRAASWGIQVMNLKKMGGSGFPTRYLPEDTKKKNPFVDLAYIDAMRSGKLDALKGLGPEYAKFDPLALLGYGVRAAFCASPCHVFIFRDLSQIEVRLAHWLCLNKSMMELFRANGDPYIDFASKFFKIGVGEVTKEQRQLSKPIVLGCNYGMGATRLAIYAKNYGVILTDEEAAVYVHGFRRLYPLIPKLWKALENAAIQCVQDGKRRRIGRVFAGIEGPWFYFELPSGRKLFYLHPEVVKGKMGYAFTFQSHHGYMEKTWGGTFLENLCQAITADLTNITITRAEAAGLNPIINQHDEIGCEVLKASAKEAGEEFGRLIESGTEWTADLPVSSDMAVQERWIK